MADWQHSGVEPDGRAAEYSMSERARLVGSAVTLDGKTAVVVGRNEQFATVLTLDGSASFQWAWKTVKLVLAAGGAFESGQ